MLQRTIVLLFVAQLLSGCGPSQQQIEATATVETLKIQVAIQETADADRGITPYAMSPRFEASLPGTPVVLEWRWHRKLESNEAFDVKVGMVGQTRLSIAQITETRLDISNWLRYQGPGTYSWTVQVVTVGSNGKIRNTVSRESYPYTFALFSQFDVTPTLAPPFFPYVDNQVDYQVENWSYVPSDTANLNNTTAFSFGPNKYLYVLTLQGDIFRVPFEKDGNGERKVEVVYLDANDELQVANNITFHEGKLYVADAGRISMVVDSDGDGQLDQITTVATDFRTGGAFSNTSSAFAFDSDGKLYVAVSALSDHGETTQDNEATVLKMNIDGSNREIYASGIRSAYDMVFLPNGNLFAVDAPPTQLDSQLTYFPPGELNLVREGKFYGFPEVFGDMVLRSQLDNSGIGEAPYTSFPANNVPRGLTYSSGSDLLDEGIYVALAGTIPTRFFQSVPSDNMIVWVSPNHTNDKTQAEWRPIVTFTELMGAEYEQPVDVTIGPDGALYVATAQSGGIYRITRKPS